MDRMLALFEGFLTETDTRIEALPRLFDPLVCPAEGLDWLASFIALTLDARLSEEKRRTLIKEGAALFPVSEAPRQGSLACAASSAVTASISSKLSAHAGAPHRFSASAARRK